MLLTTSGTTGLPKLAVMPHATMVRTTAALREYFAQPEETNVLVATPMALSSALTPNAFLALGSGWTLHLFHPNTPPPILHACVRSAPIHLLNTVPAFLRIFLRYWNGKPFPAMRRVSFGGEVMPWSSVETIQAMFPKALVNINYGVTEAGNRVSNLDTRDPRARAGGVGKPLSHFDVRVTQLEGSSAGELRLKGPTVFLGYLQADGSYRGLDEEGFLHTGDLVSFDSDGGMVYRGRRDGLVKVGGRFVNVQAVSDVLRSLPGVADAACWATPHALAGHTLTAQVIPGPGVTLDVSALRDALATRLPSWEIPGELSVRDEITETSAGKRPVVRAAEDPQRAGP